MKFVHVMIIGSVLANATVHSFKIKNPFTYAFDLMLTMGTDRKPVSAYTKRTPSVTLGAQKTTGNLNTVGQTWRGYPADLYLRAISLRKHREGDDKEPFTQISLLTKMSDDEELQSPDTIFEIIEKNGKLDLELLAAEQVTTSSSADQKAKESQVSQTAGSTTGAGQISTSERSLTAGSTTSSELSSTTSSSTLSTLETAKE